jgi:N-acetylglucosamine-6-phosphate deacetylase
MRLLITHCHLISPGLDLLDAALEIRDGRIHAIHPQCRNLPYADETVNVEGNYVLPGFIDIHTHGAGGGDVNVGGLKSLRRMAEAKLAEGVTTFLPTTLTLPFAELQDIMSTVAAYQQQPEFSLAPSVHIEGPFINPDCLGAQNPAFVRAPDFAEIQRLQLIAPIALISLAAEMPGGIEFIRQASAAGITTSLAHTAATYAEFLAAKTAGLRHLTHFCNQMTPLRHREIGIVGAGLIDPDILIELISDKVHLCADMIQLVFQQKPLRQLMLITDSMAASHMPDGEYEIGGLKATVSQGAARLLDGTLAGSILTMNQGLRNIAELTQRPLSELVATTSWNQAQSLGLEHLGKLEPGFQADLVVLNESFQVQQTYIRGVQKLARETTPIALAN